MNRTFEIVIAAPGAAAVGAGITSSIADVAGIEAHIGELRGAVLSVLAPVGDAVTQANPDYKSAAAPAPAAPSPPAAADWPSYNKTLTSERFSDFSQIPVLAGAVVAVLCAAVVVAFIDRARMTESLFLGRSWGFVFPLIGIIAIVGIFSGARQLRDSWPFAMTVALFVSAFLSLAVMFWPYMIPYSITVAAAAAPEASLSFLFWGAGLFVLPVIGAYTAVVYWMFRGKQRRGYTPTSAPPTTLKRS
jgi:hypothetical protein